MVLTLGGGPMVGILPRYPTPKIPYALWIPYPLVTYPLNTYPQIPDTHPGHLIPSPPLDTLPNGYTLPPKRDLVPGIPYPQEGPGQGYLTPGKDMEPGTRKVPGIRDTLPHVNRQTLVKT